MTLPRLPFIGYKTPTSTQPTQTRLHDKLKYKSNSVNFRLLSCLASIALVAFYTHINRLVINFIHNIVLAFVF
ncbi:hypothetical protein CROQUDRAFT_318956 [Cronartium quercuum f. sp. fusiforme G11]|uniref:Uncharacterized protein n=1 Tax=Cronartium quercuum f. sp. fusiforme G11 TaxID=708437 RepID=A0A9P6NSK6_9BASI|nr:hypothetical protein CROQUDRAFT_318956 [Cronartium quercuum f. sp. fusiforme G11]